MLYGSLCYHAAMPIYDCSHQLGEGQAIGAGMPSEIRPPQLVLGGYSLGAFMPDNYHPHQLGKGLQCGAAMPTFHHPSQPVRKGHNLYAHQAATVSPFPINLWEPYKKRSNARGVTLPPDLGHTIVTAMLCN